MPIARAQTGAHSSLGNARFIGTVDLSKPDDKYDVTITSMEPPETEGDGDPAYLRTLKKSISLAHPHHSRSIAEKPTSIPLPPLVATGFVADSLGGIPSDNYVAVSNGQQLVSVINANIAVHDATTGAYTARKNLMTLSVGAGHTSILYDYRYDPKVVYDPGADRFICVMLNATNQYNAIIVGFSKTNNAGGAWNFYALTGDYLGDTTWFDYPAISITKNEFFLTGNKIHYSTSWQAGFHQTLIYQFRKQDGFNGDSTLGYQIWDSVRYNGSSIRCLYPLNPGDSLMGPSQYFLSDRDFDTVNDSVFLVKIPDTIGSAGNVLSVTPLVSNLSYGVPPDARQPDTSLTLATNDGRVLGGFITANQIQFVCESIDTSTGSSAIYHGIINNYATTPTVTGHLYTVDSLDFGYPNISYTGNIGAGNQAIISFDYSGPHSNPGLGAIYFDGSNYSPITYIRRGDSTINQLTGQEQRWGDYSGSQPVWNNIGRVWVEGIYGRHNLHYGNYTALLANPYLADAPEVEEAPRPASKLYPNPAVQYVQFEFEVPTEQTVKFLISDLSGHAVDVLPDHLCSKGRNNIDFNIASLAHGNYLLTMRGTNGDVLFSGIFTRK